MNEIQSASFRIKKRLKKLHEEEKSLTIAISNYNKQIKVIQRNRKIIVTKLSNNMKYRNKLINQL